MSIFTRILWITLAIIVWILAFEGNIGKGLACILTPKTLEVTGLSGSDAAPQSLDIQAQ